MNILYNCHTDGDNHRITKFNDGEVESSYLCSPTECQCPAGSRTTCRHRQMLPMFIDRGAVDSFWFLDWERKGWVSNEPALNYCERSELGSHTFPKPYDAFDYTNRSELDSSSLEPALIFNPTAGIPKASFGIKDAPSFDNATWFSTVQPIVKNEKSTKPPWRRI